MPVSRCGMAIETGAFSIWWGTKEDLFSDNELEMLYGIGHQVSIALERAWLHENMEQLVAQRTAALTAEISLRKEYEARIVRLNRIYSVLSGINTTIVRVRGTQELFDDACRLAVDHGQIRVLLDRHVRRRYEEHHPHGQGRSRRRLPVTAQPG